jgi:hypothetical protein
VQSEEPQIVKTTDHASLKHDSADAEHKGERCRRCRESVDDSRSFPEEKADVGRKRERLGFGGVVENRNQR